MAASSGSGGPSKRRRIAGENKPGETPPAPPTRKTVKKPVARPGVPRTPEPVVEAKAKDKPAKPAKPARVKAPAVPPVAPTPSAAPAASTKPASRPVPAKPTASVADDAPRAPRRSLKALAPLVLAAVLAVVLGVLGVGYGYQSWQDDHGITSAHDQAADAAAAAAETIFTYDYTTLDAHLKKSQRLMTPAFAKKFETISPALDQLAPQRKIQVKAESRDAAAVPCGNDCTRDKTSVLLFVDQARLADGSTTPTVFGNRITVSMVKTDGRWLVDDITAL